KPWRPHKLLGLTVRSTYSASLSQRSAMSSRANFTSRDVANLRVSKHSAAYARYSAAVIINSPLLGTLTHCGNTEPGSARCATQSGEISRSFCGYAVTPKGGHYKNQRGGEYLTRRARPPTVAASSLSGVCARAHQGSCYSKYFLNPVPFTIAMPHERLQVPQ